MTEWMTVGEYFYGKDPRCCIETFKTNVRKMKLPHQENSWPYKYSKKDLDRVYEYTIAHTRLFVY